jgi:uncharacterized protein YutE (UPF0331/DUF86 family)/predicted nucleotidyltransferase
VILLRQQDFPNAGEVIQKLERFFAERLDVVFAYLFGSVATGACHRNSDIDIAVYVAEPYPGHRPQPISEPEPRILRGNTPANTGGLGEYQARLWTDMSQALETDNLDLVILNHAPVLLCHRVLKYGIVISSNDEEARINFAARTISEYCDTEPLRELNYRYLRQQIISRAFGNAPISSSSSIRDMHPLYDRQVVSRYLADLNHTLNTLERMKSIGLDEFISDPRNHWAVERGLLRCIQDLLNISNHILAGLGFQVPETYRGSILAMASARVIPREFAEQLAPMAGFRNILVHDYIEVNLEIVYSLFQGHLNDFREFTGYIARFLGT